MKYNELIQLYFERSNAILTYWMIFVTGIGALIAFSAARKDLTVRPMLFMSLGFLMFASLDIIGLLDVNAQRRAVIIAINQYPLPSDSYERALINTSRANIVKSFIPFTDAEVLVLHLTIDLLTIAGLWLVSYKGFQRSTGSVPFRQIIQKPKTRFFFILSSVCCGISVFASAPFWAMGWPKTFLTTWLILMIPAPIFIVLTIFFAIKEK
jgi:hypothetical protein